MSVAAVAKAIRTRALADTGAGGLFQTGTPLITGWFWSWAPPAQAFPYVVANFINTSEDDTFDRDEYVARIQFSIYLGRESAESTAITIANRIRTRFHRWLMGNVDGWIAGQMARRDGNENHTEEAYNFVEEYDVRVAKTAAVLI